MLCLLDRMKARHPPGMKLLTKLAIEKRVPEASKKSTCDRRHSKDELVLLHNIHTVSYTCSRWVLGSLQLTAMLS